MQLVVVNTAGWVRTESETETVEVRLSRAREHLRTMISM